MANTLSDAQRTEIEREIFAGRKIQAIKFYRATTGDGLKEAKDAVEAIEVLLRQSAPERFSAGASKAGCMSMIFLFLVPVGLVARLS